MTAHDPDVQRAIDDAARELARRLRPWVAESCDLDRLAAAYVEDLHGQGWRPIPRPQAVERRPAGDPPNTEWRQAADRIRNRTEGDPHD